MQRQRTTATILILLLGAASALAARPARAALPPSDEPSSPAGPSTALDIVYAYDALDRLIGVTYGNGDRIAYTYDLAGNITETRFEPGP